LCRKMVKHCIIKVFVILAMYFEGDEKKLRRIGCVAHVYESLKGSNYFGDTVIYGRIILKRILKC